METKEHYLAKKLDLESFLDYYSSFLSRKKNISLAGDRNLHLKYIKELDKYDFTPPPTIHPCDDEVKLLKKNAVISLDAIVGFVKTIRYLKYLKCIGFKNALEQWVQNINIPDEIEEINQFFDDKYDFFEHIDEELSNTSAQIGFVKEQIKRSLSIILSKSSLSPYLVDNQIHIINAQEALLLRGGFNKIIPSKIISRSSSGFFYVIPYSVLDIKSKLSKLLDTKEAIIYKITKQISAVFAKHISFLEFSQRSFNRFDGYQSRVMFARSKNLEFMPVSVTSKITLSSFSHPAIENPVSIDLDFSKTILIVTGVNAGGKTMLLKSILSAVFLAKLILPMNIKSSKSQIGSFQEIVPIIEDPQNVKENISTFAGRMLTFSKLFNTKKSLLVGIDEIELGTDSNEAASLFEAILQELIKKENKIIVTTHHKKLASSMAKNKNVELLAAIYNEEEQKPTYRFLQGTIGKSFAFETALRYNIPSFVVAKAKEYYGNDYEDLSGLIEKSTRLEYEMEQKKQELEDKLEKVQNIKNDLYAQKEKMHNEYKIQKEKMEQNLNEAIEYARQAIKESSQNAHKLLDKAHKVRKVASIALPDKLKKDKFSKGDTVKYNSMQGQIVAIKGSFATIQSDILRLKVPIRELKHSKIIPEKSKIKIDMPKSKTASLSLDLHGVRADEAMDKLDDFLSNAAMNDLSEVTIYHGMGSGRLAYLVKEFLDIHPCILEYRDAPVNMGGYGATIAVLSMSK